MSWKRNSLPFVILSLILLSFVGCRTAPESDNTRNNEGIVSLPGSVPDQEKTDPPKYNTLVTNSILHMYDEKIGWLYGKSVVGNDLELYMTQNGGKQWDKVMPDGNILYMDQQRAFDSARVAFFDPKTFWILDSVSDERVVYKTTDGGQSWVKGNSWIPASKGMITDITFINEMNGWITLDKTQGNSFNIRELYFTKNGGVDWSLISSYENSTFPTDGLQTTPAFIDAKVGFISLYNTTSPIMFKTADGGLTWVKEELSDPELYDPMSYFYYLSRPQFFPDREGIAFMIATTGDKQKLYYYITRDNGASWIPYFLTNMGLKDFNVKADFVNTAQGWVSFDSNNLYRVDTSTVELWELAATVENITGLDTKVQKISGFDFVNEKVGWVTVYVENEQRLYQTIDGGTNWTRLN